MKRVINFTKGIMFMKLKLTDLAYSFPIPSVAPVITKNNNNKIIGMFSNCFNIDDNTKNRIEFTSKAVFQIHM